MQAVTENGPRPVFLLAGFNEDASSAWARQWLAGSGLGGQALPRRAWLENRDRPALFASQGRENTALTRPTPRLSFTACACCSGLLVFQTQLNRLLKQKDWDELLIQVAASAKLQSVLDFLASENIRPWLKVGGIWLSQPETSAAIRQKPAHPLFEAAEQHLLATPLS